MTNALGQTTRYEYDGLNNLTKVTDALGGATTFGYDPNGNLLSVTDPRNTANPTTYAYDNMDRLATRTDPLTHSEGYIYDGNGNLTSLTDRRGKVTSFSYDALDRRTFAGFGTLPGPAYESTINYTYDAGNRLTSAVDSISGTISRGYDGLDSLTSESTPQGSISYSYDFAERKSSMTVAGQPAVSYSYDNDNRLTQITQGTSNVGFVYDNANRRSTLTLPNGIAVQYSYDQASRLTGLTYQLAGSTLGNLVYSYDDAGRRTQMGGSFARTGLPQPLTSATYNVANQLTQWGTATLAYDNNGNLTNNGISTYTWDARNQLSAIGSMTFQYDAFGRRMKNGAGINFLYDGANAVQELVGGTPTANRLTGGVDEFFIRTDSSGTYAPLSDALGSAVALTDSSGTVQTQYTYEPYGNTTVTGLSSSNPFQYTNRENDNIGLYYYRARYYAPAFDRFISGDPIGSGGFNLYAYVSNSPVNLTDPTGESPFIDCNELALDVLNYARLKKRQFENAGAGCRDKGHDKAIKQAEKALQNALDRFNKHNCPPELIKEALAMAIAAGVAVLAPELIPEIEELLPAFEF